MAGQSLACTLGGGGQGPRHVKRESWTVTLYQRGCGRGDPLRSLRVFEADQSRILVVRPLEPHA